MAGKQRLGILVPTGKNLDHLIGMANAAKKAGKLLTIFFTHDGVLLTQQAKYPELAEIIDREQGDEISLCNVGWEEHGLKGKPVPAAMGDKDLATQSRHGAMLGKCDRYLVM
jgi:sulfur relay (sulfurtransferase) complex TusBCD TusD component (DsrE family)